MHRIAASPDFFGSCNPVLFAQGVNSNARKIKNEKNVKNGVDSRNELC